MFLCVRAHRRERERYKIRFDDEASYQYRCTWIACSELYTEYISENMTTAFFAVRNVRIWGKLLFYTSGHPMICANQTNKLEWPLFQQPLSAIYVYVCILLYQASWLREVNFSGTNGDIFLPPNVVKAIFLVLIKSGEIVDQDFLVLVPSPWSPVPSPHAVPSTQYPVPDYCCNTRCLRHSCTSGKIAPGALDSHLPYLPGSVLSCKYIYKQSWRKHEH